MAQLTHALVPALSQIVRGRDFSNVAAPTDTVVGVGFDEEGLANEAETDLETVFCAEYKRIAGGRTGRRGVPQVGAHAEGPRRACGRVALPHCGASRPEGIAKSNTPSVVRAALRSGAVGSHERVDDTSVASSSQRGTQLRRGRRGGASESCISRYAPRPRAAGVSKGVRQTVWPRVTTTSRAVRFKIPGEQNRPGDRRARNHERNQAHELDEAQGDDQMLRMPRPVQMTIAQGPFSWLARKSGRPHPNSESSYRPAAASRSRHSR